MQIKISSGKFILKNGGTAITTDGVSNYAVDESGNSCITKMDGQPSCLAKIEINEGFLTSFTVNGEADFAQIIQLLDVWKKQGLDISRCWALQVIDILAEDYDEEEKINKILALIKARKSSNSPRLFNNSIPAAEYTIGDSTIVDFAVDLSLWKVVCILFREGASHYNIAKHTIERKKLLKIISSHDGNLVKVTEEVFGMADNKLVENLFEGGLLIAIPENYEFNLQSKNPCVIKNLAALRWELSIENKKLSPNVRLVNGLLAGFEDIYISAREGYDIAAYQADVSQILLLLKSKNLTSRKLIRDFIRIFQGSFMVHNCRPLGDYVEDVHNFLCLLMTNNLLNYKSLQWMVNGFIQLIQDKFNERVRCENQISALLWQFCLLIFDFDDGSSIKARQELWDPIFKLHFSSIVFSTNVNRTNLLAPSLTEILQVKDLALVFAFISAVKTDACFDTLKDIIGYGKKVGSINLENVTSVINQIVDKLRFFGVDHANDKVCSKLYVFFWKPNMDANEAEYSKFLFDKIEDKTVLKALESQYPDIYAEYAQVQTMQDVLSF